MRSAATYAATLQGNWPGFSLSNPATSPRGAVASLRTAALAFIRQPVNTAPSFSSGPSFEADENQTAAATVVAADPDSEDAVTYDDGHGAGKLARGISSSRITPPAIEVTTLVSGLTIPWDVAFAPDGTMLFTERGGVLSSRSAGGTVRTVTAELGDLFAAGETGLMAIVVDPGFASNRRFYTCQGHTGPEIQVIAWTISADYGTATRVADPLVGGLPIGGGRHGGCRLRFGPEGYLWIATGDAASGTVPQDLASLGGKVLRVDAATGAGAPANPFASSPRVYTYGHRNPQGLALRPGTSQMWAVEHGPSKDDEINLLAAGGNYGWDPVPGYSESVSMTDLVKFPGAVEARWSSGSSTLATSGGIFLEGEQWGVWEGRLAVATLKDRKLRLFEFTPDGAFVSQLVVPELDGDFGRLRTPMTGPGGALYVTTSNGGGRDRILRVSATRVALNQPPVAVGTLAARTLSIAAGAVSVEVSGAFSDPEEDALTYGASSSNESVVTASATGSAVTLTPVTPGAATITVTATDAGGSNMSATQTFGVRVAGSPPPPPPPPDPGRGGPRPRPPNRPPEAVGTLADQALTVGADAVTVDVAPAFRDPDRDALTYAAESAAADVAAAAVDGSVVTVTPVGAGTAVVTVTASDGEEGNAPAEQAFTVTVVVDYDSDADGLIEVGTLAQLDAVRHDLDGDGVPAAAGAEAHAAAFAGAVGGLVCGGAGCRGYELLADLDFDTNGSGGPDADDAYWRDGSGWLPVGTGAEPFAAVFEGNGRVIRGLFVAGGENAGLFGATAPSSVVARVGLIGVDVAGTQAVGALAGRNGGRVTASWATGRVSGSEAVGGLAGSNAGNVGGSYAAVAVSGERRAGGLVGLNEGGLRAVYATGRVSGTAAVGGLVGRHRGVLTASYATGRVRGERDAGGLVGAAEAPGTATASYWDTETSGVRSSAAGRGLTTSALQRPTAYGGLYAAWNVDVDGDGILDGPWHLGTAAQYPALALDVDGDGRASWPELGRQFRAGPELTAAPTENLAAENLAEVALAWTAADTGAWTPPPAVAYTVTRETGTVVETVAAAVRGTRYVDAAVQPGSAYTYQVAAVVDGGEAARSVLVTAEVPCAYAVTPLRRDVLWTPAAGRVAVTTGPGCAWTAASESTFLSVTGGATGTGPGTARYAVAANAGGPRQGALAVAGRRVTVHQASPTVFTDHPIERGVTPVRAIHFLELRARIDALRAGAGLTAFGWTDPVLAPEATPIRLVHLTEPRAALAEAYAAAGRAAPRYTDPVVAAGATAIRAAHLMELRAAVAALE